MKILFDIGGSKMRIAGTRGEGSFTEPVINKTPPTAEEGLEIFSRVVEEIRNDESVEGLYGGITGVWDAERDHLVYSPNMEGWVGTSIRSLFTDRFSVPFVVENDADIVGLGEARFGAGKGSAVCAYITISTGVGGGRIVDGRIDRSTVGFEPGHHILHRGLLEEGQRYEASFEGHVSGTALEQRSGVKAYEIPQDDDVWEELAHKSALGVYNSILFWSPDTIVLGGSMIVGDPAIPIDRIRDHVYDIGAFLPTLPEIKKAELESIGGIYGALALSDDDLS